MEFAKKDNDGVIVIRRTPEQKEHRRKSFGSYAGGAAALGGSFALGGGELHNRIGAQTDVNHARRAATDESAVKHLASAGKRLKRAKKFGIASNVALGGAALLTTKGIYHEAKSTPKMRVIHKASNAQKKKLRQKSDLQEAGAIGALSGGGMAAYYGAKELGAAGRARRYGFEQAGEAAAKEAQSNPGRYSQARTDTFRVTPPKAAQSSSKEVAVRRPEHEHRTWAAHPDSDHAKATRTAAAQFEHAGEAFKAGKRLRSRGLLLGGAGVAGIGGAVELQRRSIKNQKKVLSKADEQRRVWAEVNKALHPIEGFQQTPEKQKKEAAIGIGATTAVAGGVTTGAAHDVARRAGIQAVKADKNAAAATDEAAQHARWGGGTQQPPGTQYKRRISTRSYRTSGKKYHRGRAQTALNEAKSYASWGDAQRQTVKRARRAGKVGIGLAAAGTGAAAYGYHRKTQRKREFGKASVSKADEKERKPLSQQNPLVVGGTGTAAAGGALFAGSRVPYHIQRHRSRVAEGVSTEAWRQKANSDQFGQKAKKEAMKPSGKSTGWDAARHFNDARASEEKAKLFSTKSTSAKAGAIKIASVGRKGLIGVLGGGAVAGAGLAYSKHKERKAARA